MKAPEELPGADAFDSFYDRYQRRLRGFLTGFNGDLAVVDDLVQETLVRAYRHAIHLEVGGDPWPWLSRVARNLAADAAKRAPRLHEESGQTERLPTFGVEDPGIARMADQIDVARALGYVSRRQARLLLAFYVHQRDYEQIATAEGVTVDAVRSLLYRARRAFRTHYRIGTAVAFIVAGWRVRLRTVRDRLRDLSMIPGELQAVSVNGFSALATGAALGALSVLGALAPAEATLTPQMTSVTTSAPITLRLAPATPEASAETAPGDLSTPAPPTPDPEPSQPPIAEPVSAGVPEADPGVPEQSVIAGAVATEDVVPLQQSPAAAGVGVENDDESMTLYEEVTVSPDIDGDGEGDTSKGAGAGAVVDCRPEYRRWLTNAVCPVNDAMVAAMGS